jgi:hypothetical protein
MAVLFATSSLSRSSLGAEFATNIIDHTYGAGAGSFELGLFVLNDPVTTPMFCLVHAGMTNIVGWSVGGSSGVHWLTNTNQKTTDGYKALDLQGGVFNPASLSSLWTTFPTVLGNSYTLTFDASAGNGSNTANVTCGSLSNQVFSGPVGYPSFFDCHSFPFTALSTNTTLLFQVTASDGYGPIIDNVSVTIKPHLTIRVSEVELSWDSTSNKAYTVRYKSDVATNMWDVLEVVTCDGTTNRLECLQGDGNVMRFYDRIPVGQKQRFYDLVVTNCFPGL